MYTMKWAEETAWAVVVAVAVFVLGDLAVRQDFTEWKTWLPVLGAGVVRLVAGVLLSRIKPTGA